jgi:hypothetical protein
MVNFKKARAEKKTIVLAVLFIAVLFIFTLAVLYIIQTVQADKFQSQLVGLGYVVNSSSVPREQYYQTESTNNSTVYLTMLDYAKIHEGPNSVTFPTVYRNGNTFYAQEKVGKRTWLLVYSPQLI